MLQNDAIEIQGKQEVDIKDIVQFIKEFYKKILLLGALGLAAGVIGSLLLGSYTATIVLSNNTAIDIPRLKYLQAALPKLEQENQKYKKNEEDEFLASESLWEKSIKPLLLVSKADGKDLLDASSLNASGSKVYSIQIIGKAPTKERAEKRVEKISNYFIAGSAFIELRDLVRGYELKAISIDSNNKKKVASAEVELEYLQKRIKNLNELKNQYPNTASSGGQVVDAKDSGAKYLPITTQIVAATTDANNLKEALARYKDEDSQNIVYKSFIEKAKPLIEKNEDSPNLANTLLAITEQIEKNISGTIQLIAIEEIKVALSSIQTNKIYGLKQAGTIDVTKPAYTKFIVTGLLGGLFAGLLLAIGIKVIRQLKTLNYE